jgi:hypothetical protein
MAKAKCPKCGGKLLDGYNGQSIEYYCSADKCDYEVKYDINYILKSIATQQRIDVITGLKIDAILEKDVSWSSNTDIINARARILKLIKGE